MKYFNSAMLGDVCENISRRFDFSTKEKIVFINTGDVLEGKFLHTKLSHKDNLPGQAKKAIKKNDILVSEIRPINKRHVFVEEELENHVVSTKFMVIKAKNQVLPKYLYYFFKDEKTVKKLQREAESRSGTFPQITFESIEYFSIYVPPKNEQIKIIFFIDQIEKKIELNLKTNQTLEEIAKSLFKSWFIDFDPTKAKADGRPTGLSKEISDLFPNSFEKSELGNIPTGWNNKNLSNFCTENKKKIYPNLFPKQDFETYDIPSFDLSNYPSINKGSSLISQKSLISDEMILISKLNPENPRIWNPLSKSELLKVSSTEFISLIPNENVKYFLLCHLQSYRSIKTLSSMVTGTSKSHQRVRKEDVLALKTICPTKKLIELFNKEIKIIYSKIELNLLQIKVLKELRNILIPKLTSGELRLSDSEDTVDEVGT